MKTDTTTKPAAKPKRPARTLVPPTKPLLSDGEREAIMHGANERRAKIDLSVLARPADPPALPVAPVDPVVAEAPAVASAADPAALPAGPWDVADPHGKDIPFLLRMPPPLHAKMTFLSAHLVPHKAKHPLAIAILSAQFDALIRAYYAGTGAPK